jgi:hypothetical protein
LIDEMALADSPRIRQLDLWKIFSYRAFSCNDLIYALQGWTVLEADGFTPPARLTKTSPIASCNGNVITTASGSLYTLLRPCPNWVYETKFKLDENQYIPNHCCNPWIKGDNWKTY